MSKKKVIIIGAGAGGMATANLLAKAGYDVSVYEKNAGPGGRMDILKRDGFTFDTGPSWYLMKDVFEHYFSLFDKKTSDYYKLTRLKTAYKVFYDYRPPLMIDGDYRHTKKSFRAAEAGSDTVLDLYIARAKQSYELALKYFLYNPFTRVRSLLTKEVLFSLPIFLPLFVGNLHNYIKKRFKTLALQQILEYPSVFLGASPYSAPALYQLMSYLDFKEGVFYPPKGGMYEVTRALVALGDELGVKFFYNKPAERIVVEDGCAVGIEVAGKTIKADMVVSNADLYFTETKLLEPANQTYPEKYWQKRQAGPSALLLYLGVEGALPDLAHHNLFFVKKWRQNFDAIYKTKQWPRSASMYVSKTSATDKTVAPEGHEALFVLVPLPAGVTKPAAKVDRYIEHCIDEIAKQSGCADLKQRILFKEVRTPQFFSDSFNSWHYTALGMSHTLRQSAFLRPRLKSKKAKNLYYVGAGTQPGIGVPMCLISAQILYKLLTNDHSAGPLASVGRGRQ